MAPCTTCLNVKGKEWKIARILEVQERKVKLLYTRRKNQEDIPVLKILERSHRDISIILSQDEISINSDEYRKENIPEQIAPEIH